jgi:glycine cleavage system H protein
MVTFEVAGYELVADRAYDPATHMWVELDRARRSARVGLDPLGRETSGDVVALSLHAPGTAVRRGEAFGDLEAAKFVGPLSSPVSGVIAARSEAVLAEPWLLNHDAAGQWLVEIELDPAAHGELDELLTGEPALREWFAAEVERFRRQGAIAE